MKHTSIDPCTRAPIAKNCKYTEVKLCFRVSMSMLFTLCDSHQYPVFTATQRFKIFAEDLLPIARHLLHYIALYWNKGELTRVSFLE